MTVAFISIEGVLGTNSGLGGFQPVPEAIRFVSTLKGGYKVLLSSVAHDRSQVEHWLTINGLTPELFYEELMCRDAVQDGLHNDEVQHEQICNLRGRGYGISLVVAASANVVADAVSMGLQGLLWASPTYIRPDMQPGGARRPKSWAVIEEEIERQALLKNGDRRRVMPEEIR